MGRGAYEELRSRSFPRFASSPTGVVIADEIAECFSSAIWPFLENIEATVMCVIPLSILPGTATGPGMGCLVGQGIDSISLNPDTAIKRGRRAASAEQHKLAMAR
jgi:hypothetical protein